MKKIRLTTLVALCFVLSCHKDDQPNLGGIQSPTPKNGKSNSMVREMRLTSTGSFSQFIPIDTANLMIRSYLASINYPANDSDLQSIIIDANVLRKYLNDSSNGNITHIKLMFAHTLEYIRNGNYGIPAGYQTGELTIIIAGYDNNNNYIYNADATVLDKAMPCPDWCPSDGTAQYATIPH